MISDGSGQDIECGHGSLHPLGGSIMFPEAEYKLLGRSPSPDRDASTHFVSDLEGEQNITTRKRTRKLIWIIADQSVVLLVSRAMWSAAVL